MGNRPGNWERIRSVSLDSACVFKNNASSVKGIKRTETIGRGAIG